MVGSSEKNKKDALTPIIQVIIGALLIIASILALVISPKGTAVEFKSDEEILAVATNTSTEFFKGFITFNPSVPGEGNSVGTIDFGYRAQDTNDFNSEIYFIISLGLLDVIQGCGLEDIKKVKYPELPAEARVAVTYNYISSTRDFDNNPDSKKNGISYEEAQGILNDKEFGTLIITPEVKEIDAPSGNTSTGIRFGAEESIQCRAETDWLWTSTANGYSVNLPPATALRPGNSDNNINIFLDLSVPQTETLSFDKGNINPQERSGLSLKWRSSGETRTSSEKYTSWNSSPLNLKFNSSEKVRRQEVFTLVVGASLGAGVSMLTASMPGLITSRRDRKVD